MAGLVPSSRRSPSFPWRRTRRLQLAAENSGSIGVAVRRWRRQTEAADFGQPTASVTRWRVSVLPSSPVTDTGRRTRTLAARTDPLPCRRECRFRSGGVRCRGSSRSFLPTWPTDRMRRSWPTPRLRLRRRLSWSAARGGGGWCGRRRRRAPRRPARRHARDEGAGVVSGLIVRMPSHCQRGGARPPRSVGTATLFADGGGRSAGRARNRRDQRRSPAWRETAMIGEIVAASCR